MTLAKQRTATLAAMLLIVAGGFGAWAQVITITGHVDRVAGWSQGAVWAFAGCALAAVALWLDAKRIALSISVLASIILVLDAYTLPGQLLHDSAGYAYGAEMSWGAFAAWAGCGVLVVVAYAGLVRDRQQRQLG